MKMCAFSLAALLGIAACQTVYDVEAGVLSGNWGGRHVGLTLTAEGGRLEYDCAGGWIEGPVRPGRDGRFTATGYHVPEQGGPVQVGYVPPRWPAFYSGRAAGDLLILNVRIPATGVEIGPFQLRRNAEPVILRCL